MNYKKYINMHYTVYIISILFKNFFKFIILFQDFMDDEFNMLKILQNEPIKINKNFIY